VSPDKYRQQDVPSALDDLGDSLTNRIGRGVREPGRVP
jgi:hypothetical protein